MINLSAVWLQEMGRPWSNRRRFLTLGLAAAAASCAQHLAPDVQVPAVRSPEVHLPDWNMIKRNYETSFIGPSVERLRRVGQKVLSAPLQDGPWQFGVVKGDYELVLAFRGNGLIVSNHVLDLCENDGQLGALLAWVVMFPLPSNRFNGLSGFSRDFDGIVKADVATLSVLAKAGYDPRDALVIARRVPITDHVLPEFDARRWLRMENELRGLGYQI